MSDDVCVVILAGGVASRFGAVTQVLPKCFLPVSADETLITRLLGQLRQAGLTKVVISTSPQWFPVFEALIGCHHAASVLSNPAHAAGPLAALREAIRQIEEPRLLLALPDIFFRENPFRELASAGGSATLIGCPVDQVNNPPSSGFLTIAQGMVEALAYRQPPVRLDAFWPGVALFHKSDAVPLLESTVEGPIENLVAAAMARGVDFAFAPCGPFQNINTMEEWLQLLGAGGRAGAAEQ